MVRFLKRIKQCEINEKIKSKSELQIDINQKYIFTAEEKNQIIFFIWAFPSIQSALRAPFTPGRAIRDSGLRLHSYATLRNG